jgi:hypothetical protein
VTLTSVESPAEPSQRPPGKALDTLIKVFGVLIAVVAAILSGLLEIFLSPLRAGGFPLCVSVVIAVIGNYAIGWFAHTTVGRRWAVAPPWAVWTALMLFAAGMRTDEGDYLLFGDNWVAMAMILVGSLTYAIFAYRMILKPLATLPPPTRR